MEGDNKKDLAQICLKPSTYDLGRFKVNLSQIIRVVALHFMFYYIY